MRNVGKNRYICIPNGVCLLTDVEVRATSYAATKKM